jgi:murein peptide amidase A
VIVRRAIAVVALLGFVCTTVAPQRPGPRSLVHNRRVKLGESVDGRTIRAVEVGNPDGERTVLVVGAIHGNEPAGLAVVAALRKLRPVPDADIWVVRDLNPDGRRANTRQNGRGVDLNRNWPYKWEPIGERWDTYYSGPRPLSEPESRMARRFILRLKPDITIWYHQHMSLVYWTGGHKRIQKTYARRVGLPLRRKPKLPGAATRWQNHRFPHSTSFVVELPAGSLSKKSAKRHARAIVAIARL